ncbi:ArsB/NhaD family transporter [Lactiplantibacillus plantarum]|uniref:ArsB/NhaD family transporter n=1 Tax=Lactiplantibacillus plantarum TaxID=1590 RepID=UPI0021C9F703|nr:ArsB/NhaD family transporter [Lactiplantibacillus plantarum]
MWIPDLFSLGISILILYLYFRKAIPKEFDGSHLGSPKDAIKDLRLFYLSWVVLTALLIGYFLSSFIKAPVSLIALPIAAISYYLLEKGRKLCIGYY